MLKVNSRHSPLGFARAWVFSSIKHHEGDCLNTAVVNVQKSAGQLQLF